MRANLGGEERDDAPSDPDGLAGHEPRGAIRHGADDPLVPATPAVPAAAPRGSPADGGDVPQERRAPSAPRNLPKVPLNVPELPLAQCPNLDLGTGARGPAAAGCASAELPTLFCSEKSPIREGCGSPAGAGLWVSCRLLHSHQSALIFLRDVCIGYFLSIAQVRLLCGSGAGTAVCCSDSGFLSAVENPAHQKIVCRFLVALQLPNCVVS